jgi:hypothetical protein
MVDRHGRRVEVILLDRCDGHGPRQWIRVSWRGVLLGPGCDRAGIGSGYYHRVEDALRLVDAESLVEVIDFPRPLVSRTPGSPARTASSRPPLLLTQVSTMTVPLDM